MDGQASATKKLYGRTLDACKMVKLLVLMVHILAIIYLQLTGETDTASTLSLWPAIHRLIFDEKISSILFVANN